MPSTETTTVEGRTNSPQTRVERCQLESYEPKHKQAQGKGEELLHPNYRKQLEK